MKNLKKEIQQLEQLEINEKMQNEIKGGGRNDLTPGIRVNCW